MGHRDHTILYKCNFEERLFELPLLCFRKKAQMNWTWRWSKAELELFQDNMKGELTKVKIETFKYDLKKFYSRFDKTARYHKILGTKMKDDHVVRVFASGCYGHRDSRPVQSWCILKSMIIITSSRFILVLWTPSALMITSKESSLLKWSTTRMSSDAVIVTREETLSRYTGRSTWS